MFHGCHTVRTLLVHCTHSFGALLVFLQGIPSITAGYILLVLLQVSCCWCLAAGVAESVAARVAGGNRQLDSNDLRRTIELDGGVSARLSVLPSFKHPLA